MGVLDQPGVFTLFAGGAETGIWDSFLGLWGRAVVASCIVYAVCCATLGILEFFFGFLGEAWLWNWKVLELDGTRNEVCALGGVVDGCDLGKLKRVERGFVDNLEGLKHRF